MQLRAAELLPVEYFVQHGDFLDLKISPDGKHLAARIRDGEKVVAIVLRREDRKPVGGVQPATDDEIFGWQEKIEGCSPASRDSARWPAWCA